MKWFDGGIPSAIQAAKNNKSIFIVFITGEDEASTEMESYLHQDNMTELCERNKCVAVKLNSNSNDCKFFSQIYPVVVIPSAFFIGDTGTPLEVIGECKSPEDFMGKVQAAITLQNNNAQSQPSGSQQQSTPRQKEEEHHPVGQYQEPTDDSACGAVGGASEGNGDEDVSPEKKAKTDELNVEERVERAKQLIREKQEQKMAKEAEEAKRKEHERRSMGQGVQNLRQTQKEMDMLEAKKEMRKDKEDDKIARQRVKEQIARDRAEKNARFSEAKAERDNAMEEAKKQKLLEQQAAAAAEQARRSDISRIQFRLPDGSSVTQQFPATDTFASVFEFIAGHAGRAISLSTSFPRRKFTEADHGSTLQDLALAPSAVILVIPRSSGSGVSGASGSVGITSLLFAPFMFLWNIIASLFGWSSGSSSSSKSPSSSPATAATGGDRRNPGGARQRDVPSRQDGSLHRFHNTEDDEDDEDRATWNGNSTQQM